MADPLRVLIIDDSPADYELLLRALRKGGLTCRAQRVDDAKSLERLLDADSWDLVISDFHLPGFSAAGALRMVRNCDPDVPFILVSGAISDVDAVSMMKSGAQDFVRKDDLARLVPAVEREIREAGSRRARKAAEKDLRLAATVFENTVEGVIITDAHARIVAVNRAFSEINGYSEQEALGCDPSLLKSGRHDAEFHRNLWLTLEQVGDWRGEIWNRRKNGEIYPAWLTISSVRNEAGELTNYVGVFSDISAIKRSQQKLDHLAHHDPLTDLPNRLLFNARLQHALEQAHRGNCRIAVMFLDLDRFKDINDTLGHTSGDQLLLEIASRLRAVVRQRDTVARIGGDEFLIVLETLREPEDAALVAQKLLEATAERLSVGNHELVMTASIGISIYPDNGTDMEALVKNADAAMYRAKEQGRNNYQFYTERLTENAFTRMRLESCLRDAVQRGELFLHYQPQIDLASGTVIGAEALLRWRHPELGLVPPNRFIPVAEDSGLIVGIGEWVLSVACREARGWLDAGLNFHSIAVNVSGRQIIDTKFPRRVMRVLRETGLPPQMLELEVTESFVMQEAALAAQVLDELRGHGISIAIDDFGTGYSSLAYLKRLPLNKLKIDQSFVRDIPTDPNDEAIALAVIALGHSLQLKIVAEGIETDAQRLFLKAASCDEGQGYLFGKPATEEDMRRLLQLGATTGH